MIIADDNCTVSLSIAVNLGYDSDWQAAADILGNPGKSWGHAGQQVI